MKKTEFSKIVIICFFVASLVYTALSYILAFCGLNTVEGLSQTIVQTMWGVSGISFICYAGQNGIRAWSKNKWLAKAQLESEEVSAVYGNSYTTTGISFEDCTVSDSRYEDY